MKKKIFSIGFWLSLISCSFLPTANAQQTPSSLITAINALRASIDSLVATAATYIFQTPFNIGNELVNNYALHSAIKTIAPNVSTLNGQDIQNGLAPNIKNPNENLIQLSNIQAVDTVSQTGLNGLPVPFYSSAVHQNKQNALMQGNQNFNFISLISPPNLQYNSSGLQNFAMNYIRFVSGWGTPVSNLNLNSIGESQLSIKQKIAIQSTANYQAYMVQRRQFLAVQSAALSTLYSLYQSRLPIPTIKAADTPLNSDNPSAAQIAQYNATWRTASPTWYTQMSSASPTNVEREMLFILAELQVELHRLHVDNERLIALTAISQLGSLQTAKQSLAISEKQVQDTINQLIRQNAQQGTNTGQPSPQPEGQTQELKQSQQNIKTIQQQQKQESKANQNR